MPLPRVARPGRRSATYNRVDNQDEELQDVQSSTTNTEPSSPTATDSASLLDADAQNDDSTRDDTAISLDDGDDTEILLIDEDDENALKLIILDPVHHRFVVVVHKAGTVADLKQIGSKIHKVPAKLQRLIYRGKLLEDEATLQDVGLTEPETLLHLFPKPRVVVQSSYVKPRSSTFCHGEEEEEEDVSTTGAHIPQIVLNPEEAEQRANILVLGSEEILEAKNNIKFLSFILLFICFLQLLSLLAIVMRVPEDGPNPNMSNDTTASNCTNQTTPDSASDNFFGPPAREALTVRTWQTSDYFDLIVSSMGLYVAMLGIKATTENSKRLAKRYLFGVIATGVAWNIYYYFMNVQAGRKMSEATMEQADDDTVEMPSNVQLYTVALINVILPSFVWFLCCVRAWQFHLLLEDAEEQAGERIRTEIADLEQGRAVIVGDTSNLGGRPGTPLEAGNEVLTVQHESATIT